MLQKLCLKDQLKKNVKATRDLIGNKIGDKITLVGKSKEKKKTEEIYIPPQKRRQIIDDLRLF